MECFHQKMSDNYVSCAHASSCAPVPCCAHATPSPLLLFPPMLSVPPSSSSCAHDSSCYPLCLSAIPSFSNVYVVLFKACICLS